MGNRSRAGTPSLRGNPHHQCRLLSSLAWISTHRHFLSLQGGLTIHTFRFVRAAKHRPVFKPNLTSSLLLCRQGFPCLQPSHRQTHLQRLRRIYPRRRRRPRGPTRPPPLPHADTDPTLRSLRNARRRSSTSSITQDSAPPTLARSILSRSTSRPAPRRRLEETPGSSAVFTARRRSYLGFRQTCPITRRSYAVSPRLRLRGTRRGKARGHELPHDVGEGGTN